MNGLALPTAAFSQGRSAATVPICSAGSVPADLELPPPMRLNKGDLVDNRFRITYERSIPATVAVLTQHFAALSERNLAGMTEPRRTLWEQSQHGFREINKGERGGSTTKMRDARVLHHNSNKIHLVSGVERWNTSGEELSVTTQVLVVSYKRGIWALDLDLGYFDTRARINDIPTAT